MFIGIYHNYAYASNYNPKVEILQRNLSLLNYNPGPTDGLWGKNTKKSYYLFLNENDLPIPDDPKSFSINALVNIRLEKINETLKTIEHLDQPLTIRDAAHLLRRTGFGAHPYEVNKLLNLTRADGIIYILKGMQQKKSLSPPEFMRGKIPPHYMAWAINGFQEIMRGHRDQLKSWWLNEMIVTSVPQLEKLTLFWHNHFVSSFEGLDQVNFVLFWQNQKFREYGFSNFKLLTKLMLSDAALLKYLDNEKNEKRSPNENLARELLELFTLGEGNYSEKTIKEVSRTLTGYTVNEVNFTPYFNIDNHDFGKKTIFGKTGNFNPDDLVEIIFEQPTASTFLTSKLWKLFISELNPPNDELEIISNKFKESDYDLLILVSELLASQSFWMEENRGTIVKSPIDLLVGVTRSTGHITNLTYLFPEKVASLGQDLFEHPNVAGWPGGADWLTSTSLLGRQQEINYFVKSFEESEKLKSEIKMETKITSNEMNKKNEVLEPISLEEISFFASVSRQSFIRDSKEAGMQISLASPQFRDHYSPVLSFGLGYNLREDEVNFCLKSPGSISYFYEEYANFIDNRGANKGFCYSTKWFDENEFLRIVQSMNREDLLRVDFVCRFLGSQKRKDWFETGIAKPDFGVGSFGLEKIVEFWQSEQTVKKIDALSKKCLKVIDIYRESLDEITPVVEKEQVTETYAANELVLDTARLRWIYDTKDYEEKNYVNFVLGLNDITFNNLQKSGMVLQFLISLKKKDFKKKRFYLKFRNKSCDNGCLTKIYQKHGNKVFFPPNKNNTEGFFSLNKEDQKFVAALWLALPELIDHAELVAVKYIEDTYIPILETWKKELNEFRKAALKSPYKKYVPDFKLTIKEEDYPNSNMMDNKMMSNMMVPKGVELNEEIASGNVDDYLDKIEDLNINMVTELSDLLLSIQPVTNHDQNVNIGFLLKDPAFQLN